MSDIDWQGRYEDARDDLRAMQARAEQAESALAQHRAESDARDDKLDATLEHLYCDNGRLRTAVAALEARLAKSEAWHNKRNRSNCLHGHNNAILICETCGDRAHKAHIAALEARLADQAPVVDRAEAICDGQERRNRALGIGDGHADEHDMCGLVRAMRAARSLRGAGEGGGA